MSTIRSNPLGFDQTTPQQVAAQVLAQRQAFIDRYTWRTLLHRQRLKSPPRGADAVYDRVVSGFACNLPRSRALLRWADAVTSLDQVHREMSDEDLYERGRQLWAIFRRGRETPLDLTSAMAVIREAAQRTVGMKPYRVQVAAALALHDGRLVELATGEGKTLVAVAPAILAGFRGYGCHVITVNDYLAQRDAQWMRPLYEFFGLRVASISQESPPEERRAAYAADVTYCTNKEVAADFLRDHVARGGRSDVNRELLEGLLGRASAGHQTVQRGLACAIVDEADSILIDEAVTPLILSSHGRSNEQPPQYAQALSLVESLQEGRDYHVNHQHREVSLTRVGLRKVAEAAEPLGGMWRSARIQNELAHQALTAKLMFLRDRHYVVQEGKVVIVDEYTGRLMPDRTWRHGLHQMIEVKEQLDASPMQITLAQISFQKFFRLYRRLSGMTGTAWEARYELRQIYRLLTVRIPTNKPCIRKHEPPEVCTSMLAKLEKFINDVREIHATGRPILIGTRHVESSRQISERLTAAGLEHVVLNAVNHAQEAKIIADAGFRGAITVATNMAGRGTDIKLGPGVAKLGGLCVLAFEPNDARRIDRQLFGRAARQGDPGSARLYLCPQDLLFRAAKGSPRFLGMGISCALAQRAAQRLNFLRRRAVLQSDHWIDEHLGFTAPDH